MSTYDFADLFPDSRTWYGDLPPEAKQWLETLAKTSVQVGKKPHFVKAMARFEQLFSIKPSKTTFVATFNRLVEKESNVG